MSAYIAELNRYAAEQNALREAEKRAKVQAVRERITPLEDRLRRLLSTIPIEIQREGLSLCTLQTSLRGRRRGNCHPGELGAALRKLGFVRERRWHGNDAFRSLWYPSS